jgi:hypothetical protein
MDSLEELDSRTMERLGKLFGTQLSKSTEVPLRETSPIFLTGNRRQPSKRKHIPLIGLRLRLLNSRPSVAGEQHC